MQDDESKRLNLNRETLRDLEAGEADAVEGGAFTDCRWGGGKTTCTYRVVADLTGLPDPPITTGIIDRADEPGIYEVEAVTRVRLELTEDGRVVLHEWDREIGDIQGPAAD